MIATTAATTSWPVSPPITGAATVMAISCPERINCGRLTTIPRPLIFASTSLTRCIHFAALNEVRLKCSMQFTTHGPNRKGDQIRIFFQSFLQARVVAVVIERSGFPRQSQRRARVRLPHPDNAGRRVRFASLCLAPTAPDSGPQPNAAPARFVLESRVPAKASGNRPTSKSTARTIYKQANSPNFFEHAVR